VTVPLQTLQSETPLKIAEFAVLIVAFIYLVESLKRVEARWNPRFRTNRKKSLAMGFVAVA
jgi:hypothetical protein